MNNYCKFLIITLFPIFLNGCMSQASFDDPIYPSEPTIIKNKPLENKPAIQPIQTESVKEQPVVAFVPKQERPQSESQNEPPPNNFLDMSDYHLNAGDLISIKVFGEEDFSVTAHLNENGTISYPFLGELNLVNLTINQIEQLITTGLGKDYLVDPKVTATVLEYQKIFVNGEIKNPGGYAFIPGLTVNKAISLAGGFTDKSSRDEISIIRSENKTSKPQIADLKTYMKPGDIIIVKEYQKFFVNGEVKTPGGYTFELGMTVEKAISTAGGFSRFASAKWSKIFILRGGDESAKPQETDNLRTPIYPGDIITINESIF